MATGPGDELEAAGRGHFRASHADREQVIDVLKVAFVQGRLTKTELDARVGQAFASRTYAELAAVTADIPPGLARPGSVRKPARGEGERPVVRPGSVISVATGLYAGVWPLALLVPWPTGVDGDSHGAVALVFIATLVYLLVVLIAVGNMVAARREKHSGGQSSRVGSQASRRLPSADPGRQLPPADLGHQRTAEAAPIVGPRLVPG